MAGQTVNIEEVYDELRRAILERMAQGVGRRTEGEFSIINNEQGLQDLLPDRKIAERDIRKFGSLVCQIYHELYLERIIVPGTVGLCSSGAMQWPWYQITDHGQRFLETREYSPYDPDGYLRRLKEEIPDVDETIVRYVEESLQCLRMDCLLAAAVTIGCASEKAMLLLIEQFGGAISDPAKKEEYEKRTSTWIISQKYKAFRKSLDSVAEDLPKELRDPLESQLDGTFNLIRRTRNDAGHPSGEPVARETMRAGQVVFPDFCRYVYKLMGHLDEEGVSL